MSNDNQKTVVLLDLNRTLAEKCEWDYKTGVYWVERDVYSVELAEELRKDKYIVYLITARGQKYQADTLKKISAEANINFAGVYFKTPKDTYVKVEFFKAKIYNQLLRVHDEERFISVESNANTKAEYVKLGLTENYTRDQFLTKVNNNGAEQSGVQGGKQELLF